jgi:hypothetical protein
LEWSEAHQTLQQDGALGCEICRAIAQITPTGPALPEFCRFDEKVKDHRKTSISNFF